MMQQASGTEAFARPRFRADQLVAEAVDGDSGSKDKFIDVMDPDTGTMFRFYEAEFSLACGMDGERDVPGLISWAKEELGLMPTAAEVRNVIASLGELGFLDLTAAAQAAASEPVAVQPTPVQPPPAVARTATPRPEAKRPVAAKVDDELAHGIVVGGAKAKEPLPPAGDVELGHAGPIERGAAAAEKLPAADIALGASGAPAQKTPKIPVEEVALGAPGRNTPVPPVAAKTDVSLDLADHMAVRPDDVKEAVRQSKIMGAVVPEDEADYPTRVDRDFETDQAPVVQPPIKPVRAETPKPVRAETPKPVRAETPRPEKPVEKPVEKPAIVAKAVEKAVEKPIVAEKKAVVAEKKPVAPPAPNTRTSTRLIILFVILLALFGVYMVWKYVLRKSNSDAGKTGQVHEPVKPVTPPKPPEPPKPPPIKLEAYKAPVVTPTAPVAAQIEWVETAKTVKRDAIVVRLAGGKPLLDQYDALQKELDKVAKDLAAAKTLLETARATTPTKVPDAEAKVAAAQKAYDTKKAAVDVKKTALDKLVIRASADGDLEMKSKVGKVNANDPLFTLTPSPTLAATFKADPSVKVDDKVYVEVKGSEAGKKLTCRVIQSDDKALKVECPDDPAIAGAEVSFGGPVPPDAVETPDNKTPDNKTPDNKTPDNKTPAPGSAAAPQPPQPKPPQPRPPQPRPPQPKPPQPKPEGSGSAAPPPPPAEPKPAEGGANP